jgi:threonine/homoserine/homoserine lactone efflux protein
MDWANALSFVVVASLLVMSPGPNGLLIAKTVPTPAAPTSPVFNVLAIGQIIRADLVRLGLTEGPGLI